jgi:hypothetical protein
LNTGQSGIRRGGTVVTFRLNWLSQYQTVSYLIKVIKVFSFKSNSFAYCFFCSGLPFVSGPVFELS